MTKDEVYQLLKYILQLERKIKIEINYSGSGDQFTVKVLQKELKKPEDIK